MLTLIGALTTIYCASAAHPAQDHPHTTVYSISTLNSRNAIVVVKGNKVQLEGEIAGMAFSERASVYVIVNGTTRSRTITGQKGKWAALLDTNDLTEGSKTLTISVLRDGQTKTQALFTGKLHVANSEPFTVSLAGETPSGYKLQVTPKQGIGVIEATLYVMGNISSAKFDATLQCVLPPDQALPPSLAVSVESRISIDGAEVGRYRSKTILLEIKPRVTVRGEPRIIETPDPFNLSLCFDVVLDDSVRPKAIKVLRDNQSVEGILSQEGFIIPLAQLSTNGSSRIAITNHQDLTYVSLPIPERSLEAARARQRVLLAKLQSDFMDVATLLGRRAKGDPGTLDFSFDLGSETVEIVTSNIRYHPKSMSPASQVYLAAEEIGAAGMASEKILGSPQWKQLRLRFSREGTRFDRLTDNLRDWTKQSRKLVQMGADLAVRRKKLGLREYSPEQQTLIFEFARQFQMAEDLRLRAARDLHFLAESLGVPYRRHIRFVCPVYKHDFMPPEEATEYIISRAMGGWKPEEAVSVLKGPWWDR